MKEESDKILDNFKVTFFGKVTNYLHYEELSLLFMLIKFPPQNKSKCYDRMLEVASCRKCLIVGKLYLKLLILPSLQP